MQFLVIGLGTFGMSVVTTLLKNKAEVVAIDNNPETIEAIKDTVAMAMTLDSTNESAMRAAKIEDVDAAVVALGESQEQAVLTTVILKKLGIYPIIARAAHPLYAEVLKQVGADEVFIIEQEMGENVAKHLLAPNIHEKVFLTSGHSLVEFEVRRNFIGKTLRKLDLRSHFGVNVIAIQKVKSQIDDEGKTKKSVIINDLPGPEDIIEEGDVLVIVGTDDDIARLTLAQEV
jgi:trk system potassium uptake protein TrkA